MKSIVLIINYLTWHYSLALARIFSVWGNMIWFIWHYFSVSVLATHLFSPFAGMEGASISGYVVSKVIINVISVVLGFMFRILLLFVALAIICLILLSGPVLVVLWFLLPIIAVALLFVGVALLFI